MLPSAREYLGVTLVEPGEFIGLPAMVVENGVLVDVRMQIQGDGVLVEPKAFRIQT